VPRTAADPDPSTIFAPIDFGKEQAVVAAVSGGGDSLALLFLLKDYFSLLADAPRLVAVTVDHGLRPESADEAEAIARLCREHGIEHRVLRWEGEKPRRGIAAAAREARYRLLTKAAREIGARLILTGHTREDQIETVLMRGSRGEGRGLAGMAAFTLLDGEIWLLRPLLDTGRDDLRAFLTGRKIEWFEDPTNENLAFERPRVRARLGGAFGRDEEPAGLNGVLYKIAAEAELRRGLSEAAADFLAANVTIQSNDVAVIDAHGLNEARHDVAALALGVLTSTIGGRDFLPGRTERERILAHLTRAEGGARLTLGGAVIQCGKHRHRLWREKRGLPELALAAGESSIWDGRYRIFNALHSGTVRIASPSAAEIEAFCLETGIERENLHRAAALTTPGIYLEGKLVDLPALTGGKFLPDGIAVTRHIALFDKILPGHDFVLANATARLFGRSGYPKPPLKQTHCKPEL
jgi:tRNA(Ile)-lysidine synthase